MANGAVGGFWRPYRDRAGRIPLLDFMQTLTEDDAAKLVAAMNSVALGRKEPKRLHGCDLWEVKCKAGGQELRVLFTMEGRNGQILLALDGFSKKGAEMQQRRIDLASGRADEWRRRGAEIRELRSRGREPAAPRITVEPTTAGGQAFVSNLITKSSRARRFEREQLG